MGNSVLTNLGMSELVAHSDADYVRIATQLAHDLPRLTQLRSSMRERMRQSVLLDDRRFVRNLEDAYEKMIKAKR
jgi:predicted O-linked N-acetylglucosamine transferase (SPINDLY family)